jgi:hypothetical protein
MGDRTTASSRSPALQTRVTDFRFWILDFGLGIISIEPNPRFAGVLRAIGSKSQEKSK